MKLTGVFAAPVKAAQTLLANSATFQTWIGAADATAALARIHLAAVHVGDISRPMAIVDYGANMGLNRIACGATSGDTFRSGGSVYVLIEGLVKMPVSITRTSTTATVSHPQHGFETGDKALIEGAAQAEYNGLQTVTVTTGNAYTFTVSGSPASPATGSPVASPDPDYLGNFILPFYQVLSGIITDIQALVGTGTYLNVKEIQVIEGPSITDTDEANADEAYPYALLQLTWGI